MLPDSLVFLDFAEGYFPFLADVFMMGRVLSLDRCSELHWLLIDVSEWTAFIMLSQFFDGIFWL